jgi:hypothetical protein
MGEPETEVAKEPDSGVPNESEILETTSTEGKTTVETKAVDSIINDTGHNSEPEVVQGDKQPAAIKNEQEEPSTTREEHTSTALEPSSDVAQVDDNNMEKSEGDAVDTPVEVDTKNSAVDVTEAENSSDEQISVEGKPEAAKQNMEVESENDSKDSTSPSENAAADDTSFCTDEKSPKAQRNSLVGNVKTVTEDGETDEDADDDKEKDEDPWVIPDSNLKDPKRRICVVTTAALPWRTGTAVNPLLRALYLTRGRPKHHVTLVIPWCEDEDDRNKTLGKEHSFSNQQEQEDWIRDFCRTRANCEGKKDDIASCFLVTIVTVCRFSLFGCFTAAIYKTHRGGKEVENPVLPVQVQ